MKFNYLATASIVLALANAAALKFPRQVGGGVFSLTCNGTSGAECSKAWWTLCSVEGNIIMPAPVKWKNGDCTNVHCSCVNPNAEPVITPVALARAAPTVTALPVFLGDLHHTRISSQHTHHSTATTATFTRPYETAQPQPEIVTVVPASDATPLAGSYIWK
ncbi:hypothetical protein N431DRAFT_440040 [Stipitochalara longipes BDJ]|nr:hypothetical protein N431DRAFT_440040 [Stipitochalara longipes BDJ]